LKLGKRLKQIEAMVTANYDHIWDCCCDHGLLGAALLSRDAAPNVHFVDIVPDLMRQLENKLRHFYPQKSTSNIHSQWQVHCMDVSALPLQEFSGKHLVIIAGVGGDLVCEFIHAIHQKHSNAEIDFLLCPVHHQFTLRQQLIQLNFSLLTETLITENQRFYEILLVSNNKNLAATINPVGNLIWQSNTPEQAKIVAAHLSKTLAHYKRMQLKAGSDVQHIIEAYSAVVI
jgi:tRNA (adenine22-N1)-methyltransferase